MAIEIFWSSADRVIVERFELTSGSTWHTAGLVGQLRSDVNRTKMMKYSTDLYRKLKDETGQDTGWREVGAVFTPTNGTSDPTGLTMALAAGAKSRGAKVFLHTTVTGINVKDGRVTEVVTNNGTLKTEIVVNAAGEWGAKVGKLAGVNLPVIPMAHLYAITKPVAGLARRVPTLRDPDLWVY